MTLTLSNIGKQLNNQTPLIAFDTTQITSPNNYSVPVEGAPCHPLAAGAHVPAIAFAQDVADPLCAGEQRTYTHEGGHNFRTRNVMAFKASHYTRGKDVAPNDTAPPLSADADKGDHDTLVFQSSQSGVREVDVHATLDSNNGSRRHNGIASGMVVRRLTPTECERLMNLPDGYTDVIYNGKPAKDGPRYRALGNSMVSSVLFWIGYRIEALR